MKLAINHYDDQKYKNGDDRYGYNPICSHPNMEEVSRSFNRFPLRMNMKRKRNRG